MKEDKVDRNLIWKRIDEIRQNDTDSEKLKPLLDDWKKDFGTEYNDLVNEVFTERVQHYAAIWAKENGIKLLDFGDTRAFLNDGVLQYKRKWGMSTNISKYMLGIFGFKIYNYSKSIQSFLTNNPFIYVDKNQLNGFIFIEKDELITRDEIQQFFRTYYTPGLTQLSIISPQGFTKDAKSYAYQNHQQKIIQSTYINRKVDMLVLTKLKDKR